MHGQGHAKAVERIMFITHLKPLQPKTAITDDLANAVFNHQSNAVFNHQSYANAVFNHQSYANAVFNHQSYANAVFNHQSYANAVFNHASKSPQCHVISEADNEQATLTPWHTCMHAYTHTFGG
jgi:hypothetical protein